MKTCKKCLQQKPIEEFAKRLDGHQPWCKKCANEVRALAQGKYYPSQKQRNISSFKERRQWFISLKDNKPCTDCKVVYRYYILDYDHRDSSIKKDHVSALLPKGKKAVLAEIEKCDLVCANCHRERTWKRRQATSPLVF